MLNEKIEINPNEEWDDECIVDFSKKKILEKISKIQIAEQKYENYINLIKSWIKETKRRIEVLPKIEEKLNISFEDWCEENDIEI